MTNVKHAHRYQFGSFILDPGKRLLRRQGELVPLTPKAFDTLLVLVENSGNIVEKGELMNRLWPDTFVEESNLFFQVSTVRKALGENSSDHRYIVTIPGRGYRFSGQVRQVPSEGSTVGVDEHLRSERVLESLQGDPGNRFVSRAEPEQTLGRLANTRGLIAPVSYDHVQPDEDGSGRGMVLQTDSVTRLASKADSSSSQSKRGRQGKYYILAALILVTAGLLHFSLRPPRPPKVLGYTQITNDGQQKISLVTDGLRLYISESANNKPLLAEVSARGGETVPFPVAFPRPELDDISPSGSELFIGNVEGPNSFPFWIVPLPGGSPRRLGEIRAQDVHPSPDGQQIAYFIDSDLYLAQADGTRSRKLVTVPGKRPGWTAWAPDGSRLRFNLDDPKTGATSIWEVAANGSNLRPLLPGWSNPANECCGHWTPDGKYFLFQSTRHSLTHLWAIREKGRLGQKISHDPVQLTSGLMQFRVPVPSKDGKKIFAIGDQVRGEIMRYARWSGEWVPYHSEKSIVGLNYSRDGQWVAYVAYPEGTLWRSKADFSGSQQITFPPMEVTRPCWSPDAT